MQPLEGLRIADIGSGGGLLSEVCRPLPSMLPHLIL